MMQYKVFSFFVVLFFSAQMVAQFSLRGRVVDPQQNPIEEVEVFLVESGDAARSDGQGSFEFNGVSPGTYTLTAFGFGYKLYESSVEISADQSLSIVLEPFAEQLSEVVVLEQRKKLFALRSLKKVEGTAIFAGKKSEVVQMDVLTANLAANAPRQIYSQVVGLNIYENSDV